MPASKELFEKYPNPVFIETGSYRGDGIQLALDAGFKAIYSIELGMILYLNCIERFKGMDNVNITLGDSANMLPLVLKEINNPVTFWLDGHYSGEDTVMGNQNTPLIQELEAIKNHSIKTHTIIIDDLRTWYKDTHGFDTLDLMKKILEINPDYNFKLEDGFIPYDILVAYVNVP